MKLLRATLPALVILLFFAAAANWVPQVGWQPLRVEALPPDTPPRQLAQIGERLVRARGCLVCHIVQPGVDRKAPPRAPNLYGLGRWASLDYLVGSLYEPDREVVEGYAPIMPAATGPPAKLSYEEVVAVINYLQSLGGTPRVHIGAIPRPEQFREAGPSAQPLPTPGPQFTPSGPDGLALLNRHGCLACHALAGQGGQVGPPLDRTDIEVEAQRRGLVLKDYIRESIEDPGAHLVEGFADIMPRGLSELIPAEELETLLEYLSNIERR